MKTMFFGPEDFLEKEKEKLRDLIAWKWVWINPYTGFEEVHFSNKKNIPADAREVERIKIKYPSVLDGGVGQPTLIWSNKEKIFQRLNLGKVK